jgi:DNA-binding NarL/FixJ family response regulator
MAFNFRVSRAEPRIMIETMLDTEPASPQETRVIRVAIADDHSLVRQGLRRYLDTAGDIDVVGEASNGEEAVRLAATTAPDVVLMDVRMPVLDGVQATRRIRARGATRVLMLTTFDLDEHVVDAVRAGASGFLLKDVRPDDLVHAVRAVHAGETLLAPAITKRLLERFVHGRNGASVEQLERLSPREREVLRHLAEGRTNEEIAAELLLSPATVKTHVSRLLAKLELRDRIQAVVFAYESGLVTPGG